VEYRITSGSMAVKSIGPTENLSTIYRDESLLIEANPNNIMTYDEPGRMIICLGNILGVINNDGQLVPIKSFESFISKSINKLTLFQIASSLEGRFLLISVDLNGSSEICADKFSKIDIFIQENLNSVTLCSDLSLIPENPAKKGYDQNALAHMLTYYGYCPPKKHTIYKSVRRLGVGELATFDNGKLSIIEHDFNPINSTPYSDLNHTQYTENFLNYLKNRGSSSGNVVYLSSGWDSTSILAGLVKIFGPNKVRAVTGIMRYSDRSGVCNQPEIDKVKKITKYFGVKLDFVDFEFIDDHGIDFTDSLKPVMKNHQLYSLTVHTHGKLAQKTYEIANKGEVVFAGEISDGAHNLGFSQYATIFHPSKGFREYSDKMASYLFGPTFLTLLNNNEYIEDPIFNLFKARFQEDFFENLEDSPQKPVTQLLTSFFLRNKRVPFWSHKNIKLLSSEGSESYTKEMQNEYLFSASKNATPKNLYSWYLHLYNSFHWQGATVRSLQVLADNYGIDSDLPFWGSSMQDFLSMMPENWGRGLDLNPTKYPLKNMLKNDIDYPFEMQEGAHAYTYDTDHSFSHLEEIFLHSKLKKVMQKALLGKPYKEILSSQMFDLIYIDNLVDKYLNDEKISVASLIDLAGIAMLCYVSWYKVD